MARTFVGASHDVISFGTPTNVNNVLQSTFTAYQLCRPTANIVDEREGLVKIDGAFSGGLFLFYGGGPITNSIACYHDRASGASAYYAFSQANTLVNNSWNVCVSTFQGDGFAPKLYTCLLGGTLAEVTYDVGIGQQVGTGLITSDATGNLKIGGRDPADDTWFTGGLADSAIWNRVLGANELANLGAGYSPEWIQHGLVFSARLTGTDSPELNSKGSGSNHGTLTGTSALTHPAVIYPRDRDNLVNHSKPMFRRDDLYTC